MDFEHSFATSTDHRPKSSCTMSKTSFRGMRGRVVLGSAIISSDWKMVSNVVSMNRQSQASSEWEVSLELLTAILRANSRT